MTVSRVSFFLGLLDPELLDLDLLDLDLHGVDGPADGPGGSSRLGKPILTVSKVPSFLGLLDLDLYEVDGPADGPGVSSREASNPRKPILTVSRVSSFLSINLDLFEDDAPEVSPIMEGS